MPDDPHIRIRENIEWKNFHENVSTRLDCHVRVSNENPGRSSMSGMRKTAARLQSVIGMAMAEGAQLRTVGARWSFSDITIPQDGWIVETDSLGYRFFVNPSDLETRSTLAADELIFVQCGTKISRINEALESDSRRRALRTSGASNGQTIAGAIATGVHGSAVDVGGMESQVVGLQILTATRNLWIEPRHSPIATPEFAAKLDAELVRDDLLFSAALVNLGALGIVHSVMLKSTGRYKLKSSLKHLPHHQVRGAMNSLDFRGSGAPEEGRRPYFFQAIVDPNRPDHVYSTFRYKEVCEPGFVPDYSRTAQKETGTDLPSLVGRALEVFPSLRNLAVKFIAESELPEFQEQPGEYLTPGQAYSFTQSREGVASSGFGIPVNLVGHALQIAQAAFREQAGAPVVHTCRYVRKSPGLLSFTRYDPSCVLDVDGVDTEATQDLIRLTADRFDAAGLPYTMHWGKENALDESRVRRAFGGDVDRWHIARNQILPTPEERSVFSSPMTDRCGLT